MKLIVLDEMWADEFRERRIDSGSCRFDEVWNGDYVITPVRDNEHQEIATGLGTSLAFGMGGLSIPEKVRLSCYITDTPEDQEYNYRCVDIGIFKPGGSAKLIDPCWYGGPDFGCEIVSRNEHLAERIDFHAKLGTRELLIVDRDPWQLELLRLGEGRLKSMGTSTAEKSQTLASEVIPFTFRLEQGDARPAIAVGHTESEQSWRV